MLIRALTLTLLTLYSTFATVSWADDSTLQFYVVDFPPYIIAPDEGDIHGIGIETTQAAFAKVGIETTFSLLPWKRIMKSMEHGSALGTVSCSRRPERSHYMLFSDELTISTRVAVSRKEIDTSGIQDLQDLRNYSVVSVEDWGMEQQLTAEAIPHEVTPTLESGIVAIRYRNIDILYASAYPSLHYAKNLGVRKDIKITPIASEPSVPLYLCLSKQYPESRTILEKFNTGLRMIKQDGTYQAIRAKYL